MDKVAVVSVGNTRTRWGLWSDGAFALRGDSATADLSGGRLFPNGAADPVPDAAVVASVVHHRDGVLARLLLAELGVEPRFLGRDLPVPLEIDVDEPGSVGADRLAAALAAHRRFGAAVVVDFGTAITVNAVTVGGEFLGGAIMPGPALSLEALAAGTAGVRVGGPVEPAVPPGRSTRAAVHAGLSSGLAGAVDRLVELSLDSLGEDAELVATGGGAELLVPLCRSRFTVLPDLVLEGLVVAAQEAG
jgi:type III pantothenate kinase